MQPVKKLLLGIACFLLCTVLHAQSGRPQYDSVLAKKLGADSHGMRQYVLMILKTGPKDKLITDKKVRDSLFKGHMGNINKLAAEQKLAVAGPFDKNEKNYRGIFILSVASIEEARTLVDVDPTIKAGIFVYDAIPWYGSAALQETNDIHQRIEKDHF